jgi:hypothetical protein
MLRPVFALPFLAGMLLAAGTPAHADRLDDDLATVWEVLWDQRGALPSVVRWNRPVWYRIEGIDVGMHRAQITKALQAASAATGVSISEAIDGQEPPNLTFEIVPDNQLLDNEPCVTRLRRWRNWGLEEVAVKMRSQAAWRCTFHETMHVMGLRGHPSGKTVLSYFPWRRDVFMDLDVLMLRTWYAPDIHPGATPLQLYAALSRAVAEQPDLGIPLDEARRRAAEKAAQQVRLLENFAKGEGEVPAIVLRSGKASTPFMVRARRDAASYLAKAYRDGTLVPADLAQAEFWFARFKALEGEGRP